MRLRVRVAPRRPLLRRVALLDGPRDQVRDGPGRVGLAGPHRLAELRVYLHVSGPRTRALGGRTPGEGRQGDPQNHARNPEGLS